MVKRSQVVNNHRLTALHWILLSVIPNLISNEHFIDPFMSAVSHPCLKRANSARNESKTGIAVIYKPTYSRFMSRMPVVSCDRMLLRPMILHRQAKAELGEEVAARLKLTQDGTKVLWPQPTDSEKDPQNWSRGRKDIQLLIITLAAFVPDFDSGIGE